MTAWHDQKVAARSKVHETFKIDVVFYETGAATPAVPDDVVSIRLHDKQKMVGDLAGTNLSYAEVVERPTTIHFLVSELAGYTLARGTMVFGVDYSGQTFGFYVDTVNPRDGLTQSAYVSPLDLSDHSGKLLPDGSTVP